MDINRSRAAATALILIVGAVALALVGATIQLIVGVVSAYVIALLASSVFAGKQREVGLRVLGALAILTLIGGLVRYSFDGDVRSLQFGFGLLAGGFPGAIFGWPDQNK